MTANSRCSAADERRCLRGKRCRCRSSGSASSSAAAGSLRALRRPADAPRSSDCALAKSGPAVGSTSRPDSSRRITPYAVHTRIDADASTHPCTTWSRAAQDQRPQLVVVHVRGVGRSRLQRRHVADEVAGVADASPPRARAGCSRTSRRRGAARATPRRLDGRAFARRRVRSPSAVRPKKPERISVGVDQRHGLRHEVARRDARVQPVAEDPGGAHGHLALHRAAGSQPLRRSPCAAARVPSTVTDADDGENGPGSASDRLVATKAGNRGSMGVSNSPLASTDAGGHRGDAVGRGRVDGGDLPHPRQPPRQGNDACCRTSIRPRHTSAKSSTHSAAAPAPGARRLGCRARASLARRRRSRGGTRSTGRPMARPAMARMVVWPSAATSTVPAGRSESSTARTNTRCEVVGVDHLQRPVGDPRRRAPPARRSSAQRRVVDVAAQQESPSGLDDRRAADVRTPVADDDAADAGAGRGVAPIRAVPSASARSARPRRRRRSTCSSVAASVDVGVMKTTEPGQLSGR